MTLFSLLNPFRELLPTRPTDGDIAGWVRDPLSHPVLDTMSERELGDMPFRLTARRTDFETARCCGA
ncbi:hypothetical protein [Mesorhizobium amorphae]|uniref:hypothetical protein n=1 Tax=Mesorhizobium amorphae TaxID=71433 RepID=UPI001184D812|nr:hypothetical protein [Mesorhizobium amorphae]